MAKQITQQMVDDLKRAFTIAEHVRLNLDPAKQERLFTAVATAADSLEYAARIAEKNVAGLNQFQTDATIALETFGAISGKDRASGDRDQ